MIARILPILLIAFPSLAFASADRNVAACLARHNIWVSGSAISLSTSQDGDRIYAVHFNNAKKTSGEILVFQTSSDTIEVINNTAFTRHGEEIDLEAALGGNWTQQRMETAIRRLSIEPTVRFTLSSLEQNPSKMKCEHYAGWGN